MFENKRDNLNILATYVLKCTQVSHCELIHNDSKRDFIYLCILFGATMRTHSCVNITDHWFHAPFFLISAWISNHMHDKVWDEITSPFPNFNGVTVEVWEWRSNFVPHFTQWECDYLSMLGLKLVRVSKTPWCMSTWCMSTWCMSTLRCVNVIKWMWLISQTQIDGISDDNSYCVV